MLFAVTFLAVCVFYASALLIGWYLAKRGRLDIHRVMQSRRDISDPVTRRFQKWSGAQKLAAIRQQQWGRLRLHIFANNLGAVAFVGCTLYAMALVPAVYRTYRQGLGHGTLAAHWLMLPGHMRPSRALAPLAVLEFGSYLLATALGVNLVITLIVRGAVTEALAWLALLYPLIAAALLLGAWLEVNRLRSAMPAGVRLPEGLTMEELRAKALEMMKRHPGETA